MSKKLKAKEVVATREITYLEIPGTKGKVRKDYWRMWATTSKGLMLLKQRVSSAEAAAKLTAKIDGSMIDPELWIGVN